MLPSRMKRQSILKRLLDFLLSLIGLLLLLPVLAAISFLIKAEDGGPVFYRGIRTGKGGREFKIFKFRTMVLNAESMGGSSTSDDDPRITKIGRKLRKYKLDELPQIINVLKGEMSLVGPRPEVKFYTDMFTGREKLILSVKPGITDWASLWNADEGAALAGSSDPDRTYLEEIRPKKIELQLQYIEEQSLWTDIRILYQTIMAVWGVQKQSR
jgi:lipopolysaccharide/colanic/teichoic acid biosynthesis glycosyltransferase